MEIVLLFLKNNWKLVAIGVTVLLVAAYIGILKFEISHLKSELGKDELVIAKYKADEDSLKRQAAEITKQHEALLRNYDAEVDKNVQLTKDKVKLSGELRSTLVSLNAIKLFNESKRDPESPATAVEGNDGGSGAAKAGPTSSATDDIPTFPLTGIWDITAENDANHLKCVKQVKEWQKFWTDFVASVGSVRSN